MSINRQPRGTPSFTWQSKTLKRTALVVVLGLIVLYGVVPNLHLFGINEIKQLPDRPWYYAAAALTFLIVYVCSSVSYLLLAIVPLKFLSNLIIQFASVPLNLLLPAGIGNISVNYLYLRNHNHSRTEGGLVVGLNNTLGVVANITVILILLLSFGFNGDILSVYTHHKNYLIAVAAGLLALLLVSLWLYQSHIAKIKAIVKDLVKAFMGYRKRPLRPLGSYFCALIQCSVTGFAFWLTIKAFGLSAPYATAFLIYGLSVVVGALIPTPGGLGGVEASMTAGLVAAHIGSASESLIVVLGYRAVTFWLPMFIGVFALAAAERLKLVQWRP